ncbi:flagellar biosynthesis anti-sigma factor FlgM [Clostridium tertium]|jgi:negative regulator of flagellin synthesis FlgM|uniref:flagellar biosynthesis anti-sigma factor FlgM n=1 Tax=Clostridium TaxID=1485 RepID=UPI0011594BEB|nr:MULTISPECIES: flagellar biosynthesis anti-sigma factor FlgM [Clostridium]MBS5307400.1 flagellar biosynthesis anti-sigma factor FlgM [Clostridium sp.]MDB1922500.1 flagellar biosynthesis anti-sigma factor FlgM [Clostridium tertium]MDB1926283.1 flagellar biosynthesis anti-sigma factor FlgM [Clostridium tertium]MDB1928857.1 flagellar biosynthesis anti-sigma factor FlgM [Clostridium tertium]MDB1932237.1 flagellar biosynthesis anti-sigma factor FlgM [Clostridium tertium]
MNIKGIGYTNGINYYNKVTSNKIERLEKKENYDRIELSEAAKILKDYSIDNKDFDNRKKVLEVKNSIYNGTYTYDANLIAKSMLDAMRGKE